jgi:lon-related putative ATP-dependent protease
MTGNGRQPPAVPAKLEPRQLRWHCDPASLPVETTAELEPLDQVLGQPRAVAAFELGFGIDREGYHIFALGPEGSGRHAVARQFLERRAAELPPAPDLCYVLDFEQEHRPRLLRLPPGQGRQLREDLENVVEELRGALPAAFESEEYQGRRKALQKEVTAPQEEGWQRLVEQAREKGLAVARTPVGVVFAAAKEDKVLSPEDYEKLPQEERERLEQHVETFRGEAEKLLRSVPGQARKARKRLEELDRETAEAAVGPLLDELRSRYQGDEDVLRYLQAMEKDLAHRARALIQEEHAAAMGEQRPTLSPGLASWGRYQVNLFVDNSGNNGAPIVYEDNPTLANLVGRVEHLSQMGTLFTDYTLIKPGALHKANGGFLMLDVLEALRQPLVWDALKRNLRFGHVKIESAAQALGMLTTVTLEPEPMPLEVKLVLIGEPRLYYMLAAFDPEFGRLFKVAADFEERLHRSEESQHLYSRLIASMIRQDELQTLARSGLARVLEHSARLAGDALKLTLDCAGLMDLLREADYWSRQAGRDTVTAEDVDRAVEAREFRHDRMRERIQEQFQRGMLLVSTSGEAIGQVNALVVVRFDRFSFGYPSRITARVRLGEGKVVNIEREVELSGPIHSKGVLILSGFLGQRYGLGAPLALWASLVFEQSYGGVDGDSASLAELCALLSAIGKIPLRQSVAMTGSVNQHGEVQPVGGVNEKIEGFFDICRQRGLEGQGVLIPASNAPQLMLRQDVIDAVEEGTFWVLTVSTVDQAMEALTGLPAGEAAEDGSFPEGTINARVESRLQELAEQRLRFQRGAQQPLAAAEEEGP